MWQPHIDYNIVIGYILILCETQTKKEIKIKDAKSKGRTKIQLTNHCFRINNLRILQQR